MPQILPSGTVGPTGAKGSWPVDQRAKSTGIVKLAALATIASGAELKSWRKGRRSDRDAAKDPAPILPSQTAEDALPARQ